MRVSAQCEIGIIQHRDMRGFLTAQIRWLLFALLLLLAIAALAVEQWAHKSAAASAAQEAAQLAHDNAALFTSEIQKFRLLPIALSENPDVIALLRSRSGTDPRANAVNLELAHLAERTDAAAIFVIAANGRTLAASNYRKPVSFVGRDYSFRPYFLNAMTKGAAELFALGTVSNRPGLYIASRIGPARESLGVIVVKVEFDQMERDWAGQRGASFVADQHGVIIVASRPDWRFRTLRPLAPAARREIEATRQFTGQRLQPMAATFAGDDVTLPDGRYRSAALQIPLKDARLIALAPMAPALLAARIQASATAVVIIGAIVLMLLVWIRQSERAALNAAARHELEVQVASRTQELQSANADLRKESAERERADQRYREARDKLAQMNRLGTLGQIVAGVAHELNQPTASIRAYAENAGVFLDSDKLGEVRGNLAQIVALTDRVARISSELRQFARLRTPEVCEVNLDDAIDSALNMVRHRIGPGSISIDWRRAREPRIVIADRLRLEQVFVNLLTNAIDALASHPSGRISIAARSGSGKVDVSVADNGPGVPEALKDQIFTPFITGRAEGLGLGLAIARDIARAFGGDLSLTASGPDGTAFNVRILRP